MVIFGNSYKKESLNTNKYWCDHYYKIPREVISN
jgi:hypothetical protein